MMTTRDKKVKQILIEPHFLGSIEYFVLISRFDVVIWEVHEHFIKQTYRNRCYILGPNGIQLIPVPVSFGNRTPLINVNIDYRQKWLGEFKRTIKSAYGKAPYFDFIFPEIEQIVDQKFKYLFELNQALMTFCLKFLQCDIRLEFSKSFEKEPENVLIDGRNLILPKISFHNREIYRPVSYIQNFGSEFVPNLSILDLLMCEGVHATELIRQSIAPLREQI